MKFLSHVLAITGLLVLVFLYLWRVRFQNHKMKGLMSPEPYGALPILGHLHQLGGRNPLFQTLANMADKYGPIFTICLGKNRALVISNYEAAKECFTTNDRVFATRPSSAQGKYLGYNYAAFGVSPYGKYWRDTRKLVVMELLSSRRLETLKHVQISEVDAFVKGLYSVWKNKGHDGPSKVVISTGIEHLTCNVMTKIIAGKRYFGVKSDEFDGEVKKIRKLMKEFMYAAGNRVVSDVVGIPEWIDFKGHLRTMKNVGGQLDSLMTSWVEEHNTRKRKNDSSNEEQDFIDVLLSEIEDGSMLGHTRDTIIKSTALILVLAGSETTSVSLTWMLSLLLNNRRTLKLAQEELDRIVGRHRWVEDTDIKNLVYLQAIAKETLRLYPPGPLSVPHEAMEDCKVGGFHVPKGTHLYVNLWKLHRDPNVWPDPEVFSPERFRTTQASVDAFGQHFEFIPFGAGRRICPGITLAFQLMHLTVARLIQGFELATPLDKAVDMTEGSGLIELKVNNFPMPISFQLMDYLSHLPAITGLLVLVLLYLWRVRVQDHKMKGLMSPEPHGALPIIGHLHQLGSRNPLCRTLAKMADKYGPIFTIRLGKNRVLVISNYEAVKECFTTNDRVFATRPISAQGKYLGYNYAAFGFSPYGTYWRDMRKLVVVELLSSRRLETLKHVQVSEVDAFVKGLYSFWKNKGHDGQSKVEISEWIDHLTLNMITRMIAGKRYFGKEIDKLDGEEKRIGKLMKDFMYVAGFPVVSDVIGFPEWIDFKGKLKTMKNIGSQLESLMKSWVEEHHTKKHKGDSSNQQQDLISVLLSEIEDSSMLGHTRDTIIKATAMNLVLAGSETTAVTLTWILSLLLNNRRTLKIAQEELDRKVGRHRWVEDTDIKNLVYLQAIAKETLRLYPPGPLSVPHEAMEDCKVGGFHVPKGTHLYVNLWKLHRDPNVWPDPEVFSPERFLTTQASVDALGQHFEFIPFGAGRRICPGITFAFQLMHLTVARLIQGFELATPLDKAVDMTEGLGITMPRATALEIILTPRLASDLYAQ
ncbi:hypothetical protein ACLB2K_010990 [Fragaria x ananassa]